MSDDDSSKKIASSKDFETTTNTEDVTNADLLSLFKTYMNENIDGIQRNCDDKTHSLAKMVKKNENAFKFKGNGIQFDLNSDLIDNLERAQHYLELKKISRPSALIDDSLKALRERNKLISIADKSDGGWNTVQEYLSNEVASDYEDEKRIRAADTRALRKIKAAKIDKIPTRKRPAEAAGAPVQIAHNGSSSSRVPANLQPFRAGRAKEARLDKQSLEICVIPAVITDTGPGTAERNESPSTEDIQLETTGDSVDIFQVHVHDNFDNLTSFCDYESGLSNISVKRRLKKSVCFWLSIGISDFIIEVIKDGYKIPLRSEPEQIVLKNNVTALQHEHFVDQAISGLVDSGSVVNVQEKPHVVNPLTVSVNAKGKERLILDLRHVNEHIVLSKMKFEDVACAKQFLSSECFGFVWDLKSGYHHVDIFHSHCKYLGFEWKNNFYIFTVLPFGLMTSEYIFTKVVRSLVKY